MPITPISPAILQAANNPTAWTGLNTGNQNLLNTGNLFGTNPMAPGNFNGFQMFGLTDAEVQYLSAAVDSMLHPATLPQTITPPVVNTPAVADQVEDPPAKAAEPDTTETKAEPAVQKDTTTAPTVTTEAQAAAVTDAKPAADDKTTVVHSETSEIHLSEEDKKAVLAETTPEARKKKLEDIIYKATGTDVVPPSTVGDMSPQFSKARKSVDKMLGTSTPDGLEKDYHAYLLLDKICTDTLNKLDPSMPVTQSTETMGEFLDPEHRNPFAQYITSPEIPAKP